MSKGRKKRSLSDISAFFFFWHLPEVNWTSNSTYFNPNLLAVWKDINVFSAEKKLICGKIRKEKRGKVCWNIHAVY
jgi:hypothetical protein